MFIVLCPGVIIFALIRDCTACRLWVYLPYGSAAALFNVSQRRKAAAAWDTWLSLVVIGLLLLALRLQMLTSLRLLLQPLERMLACVKLDAAHILDSVHLPAVQSCLL